MRRTVLVFALVLASAGTLCAQSRNRVPPRPRLGEAADTNDAVAYMQFGLDKLRLRPQDAAAAFYWAMRLDPSNPHALYDRRAALLIADESRLRRYVEGDRRYLRSAEVREMDSLYLRASLIAPFFHRSLDDVIITVYVENEVRDWARLHGSAISDAELSFEVSRYMNSNSPGPETRALMAYGWGRFGESAQHLRTVLGQDRSNDHLRVELARVQFLMGALDSARAQMAAALEHARGRDSVEMRYIYDSKAQWEFMLGWIHESMGADSAAREAYQRAILEDLSFFSAHVRMGLMALRSVDSATAVTELGRAVEARPDDYLARVLAGQVLLARRAYPEAIEHLRRATELEPFAAQGRLLLAQAGEAAGDTTSAAADYERYLALASREDPNVALARRRVAALRSTAH